MLDMSWFINRGRAFLGQNVTGQVDFKDEDIIACLDQETLPSFSIYMPWLEDIRIDTKTDQLPNREGVFMIRTNERLLGVQRVLEGIGAYGGIMYDPLMFGDVVDRQLVADRQSASEISLTFLYRSPNTLEIFPKGLNYSSYYVRCKLVHPTHLRTVPPTAREILRELFLADLANDVLTVRQYFQNMQSVFGELQLNLDRLQQQADKRTEIIEKLAKKQLKTGHARRLYIA